MGMGGYSMPHELRGYDIEVNLNQLAVLCNGARVDQNKFLRSGPLLNKTLLTATLNITSRGKALGVICSDAQPLSKIVRKSR